MDSNMLTLSSLDSNFERGLHNDTGDTMTYMTVLASIVIGGAIVVGICCYCRRVMVVQTTCASPPRPMATKTATASPPPPKVATPTPSYSFDAANCDDESCPVLQ